MDINESTVKYDLDSLKKLNNKSENVKKDKYIPDISDEKHMLNITVELWEYYSKLLVFHPDDVRTFTDAIHRVQELIATRIAYKEHPEIFISK